MGGVFEVGILSNGGKGLDKYTGKDSRVVIPDEFTWIGPSAFKGCKILTSVSIPKSVTEIYSNAFSGCTNLTSVSIPDGVTKIGDCAFEGCSSLTSVSIPESVTVMGSFVFRSCTSLTSVSIPEGVTWVSYDLFEQTPFIENLPGYLKMSGNYLLRYTGMEKDVIIPKNISTICASAFAGCSSLISVSIPNEVIRIGGSVFKDCHSLTSVIIPEGVNEIGECAFAGCSSLTSVIIPKGVTKIGIIAFSDCTSLTSVSIPEGVTAIGWHAFSRCTSLTSVSIPESVTKIGGLAFSGCTSLTSVSISEGVTEIDDQAFFGCTSLTSVSIPESITKIGSCAFSGCTSLTSVMISKGVQEIGEGAFKDCSSLTHIQMADTVREIREDAFLNTPFLRNLPSDLKISGRFLLVYTGEESMIRIPQGVCVICNAAFTGNEKLTSIVFPKSIVAINSSAFQGCKNLKELGVFYHHEYNPIPAIPGFDYISINLLDKNCRQMGKLYILDSKKGMPYTEFLSGLMGGCVAHLSEYDALFISSNEIIVRKFRAALCRLQNPLELEEKYKKEYIFYLQNNAHLIISKLIKEGDIATLSLLAGFGAIPKDGINSWIDLANELSRLEILAFLMDYKHKSWGQEPALNLDQAINKPSVEWANQENLDGSVNIIRYLGSQQSVIIPALIEGKKVRSIEGRIGSLRISIFYQNKDIVKSIVIENGIEIIADRAFLECRNLKSISIPNSVTRLGKEAFFGCSSLSAVIIPASVNEIGMSAFEDCTNLTIQAPKGSFTVQYAKENKIKFVEI